MFTIERKDDPYGLPEVRYDGKTVFYVSKDADMTLVEQLVFALNAIGKEMEDAA